MKRCSLAVLTILVLHGLLAAQPETPPKPATPATPTPAPALTGDAWRQAPYQLTLVLHVDPHPLLTEMFVSHLRDEVRDALQRDLGGLCAVDVVADDPLMQEILARGWGVLDKPKFSVDDIKKHFLRVSYDNGQYTIQGRQVDGSTAIVSPLRKAHTPDRLWVSRLVALTVAQDFGMVAQVGSVAIETVALFLRGTGAKDPDSIKVQTGEVFAVSEVRVGPDGKPVGLPVPHAYLVASDVRPNGEVTTRLFSPYKDVPIKAKLDRQSLGYRALKLGTTRAALQLRVVDAQTKEPLPGCGVKIHPSGFDGLQTEELTTNAQGRVRTKDTYKNIVFAKIGIGGGERKVPFPLLSDLPVEYALTGTQEAESRARLEYRYRQWSRKVRDLALSMDVEADQIRELIPKSGEQAAALKAKEMVARHKTEIEQLKQELEEVRDAGQGADQQSMDAFMGRGQKALKDLGTKSSPFEEFAQQEINPTPAQKALKPARLADKAFDAERAIAGYDACLKLDPNQPAIKARLDKIREAWKIKGEAHTKARKFINETWASPESDLEKALPEVKNAFTSCKNAGDFFTAYKLFKLNQGHLQRLTDQRDQIASSNAEDAQERIDAINKLGEAIQAFNEEVATWVDQENQKE